MTEKEKLYGISKWELDTPCLVIDEEILNHNLQEMQNYLNKMGKQLRPHAKTHKCSRIAQKQIEAGAIGICVAKVSEAEVLVKAGLRNILITSPVVTDYKIKRLLDLLILDQDLMVVVDNAANAQKLNEAARQRSIRLNVLIDLDPGMGRTGVSFEQAMGLGKLVHQLPGLNLKGIQCYAGHVQHISSFSERSQASLNLLKQAAEVFRQFQKEGLPAEIFTGSGTGTSEIDWQIPELTDLQVGSYTLMDTEYLYIGSAEDPERFKKFPPALTLLSSVISVNHANFVTIDAGLKSIYHHGGNPEVVFPANEGWKYEWRGDEHGMIHFVDTHEKLKLGEVVELIVSHCDPTVNLFDEFYVIRDGRVIDIWPIDLRGKCQ
ncbi:MAG: DSD1 family PLP-dependent enzyme [Thermodesulfobacteriota bacterium]